jgi:hypothetical protein
MARSRNPDHCENCLLVILTAAAVAWLILIAAACALHATVLVMGAAS